MLRELSVQNLAIIEDARIELEPGFCAWTGETGAGKTLLLAALGLLLGDRGDADLVRKDADELRIVGLFEISNSGLQKLVEDVIKRPLADQQLHVMRRIQKQGRSSAYINEEPATLATLRKLGDVLVDIHGQRETQALLAPSYQLHQLDAYGGLDELRAKYHLRADAARDLRKQILAIDEERDRRNRELSLLRFEKEELDAAELHSGELVTLDRDRSILANAQALREFAARACQRLYDADDSVSDDVGKLLRDADRFASFDFSLEQAAQQLRTVETEAAEIARLLRPWADNENHDPARLEEVEARVQRLKRLEAKYGKTIDELVAYRQTLDEKEQALIGADADRTTAERSLKKAWTALVETGAELSQSRRKIAKKFAAAVASELSDLSMPDARLAVHLEAIAPGDDPLRSDVPATGFEQVEILFAANPGEDLRPLRQVASGGELSRTMRALKTVLARPDQVRTLVFDEIDANVGGRLGDVLGAKLASLGRSHQVICITHLPQVACYAPHQWTIRKRREGKRTVTAVTMLSETERLEELSSMLRGESRSETTRKEAAAMLRAAQRAWRKSDAKKS